MIVRKFIFFFLIICLASTINVFAGNNKSFRIHTIKNEIQKADSAISDAQLERLFKQTMEIVEGNKVRDYFDKLFKL